MTLLDYFDLRVAFALFKVFYHILFHWATYHSTFFFIFLLQKTKEFPKSWKSSVSSYCKKSIFLLECLSAVIGQ